MAVIDDTPVSAGSSSDEAAGSSEDVERTVVERAVAKVPSTIAEFPRMSGFVEAWMSSAAKAWRSEAAKAPSGNGLR